VALARLSICASFVVAASLVGCRSGAERDIVQRELRQQEDQIYALEDYLQEYQQLLCEARAENASLKRQMVQGQFRDGSPTGSRDETDALPLPPSSSPAPPAESSPTEPTTAPSVPSLDLSTPEVPPLDSSSANEPEQIADHAVEQVSAEIEVEAETEVAELEVVAAPPTAVVLRGEVQVDDADAEEPAGPRVLLAVEPVNDDGECVSFNGKLSVLVLDPAAPEKQRQLARWDMAGDDLANMASEAGGGYELPLQLPAESPTSRPLELWVRLLPEDGEKLLGRTTMDLSRAGRFATAEVQSEKKPTKQPTIHRAEAAMAQVPAAAPSRPRLRILDTNVEQSGWQIAKPGEIVGRAAATSTATSEWKIATRPIPEMDSARYAMSTSATVSPRTAVSKNAHNADAAAPSWTPNRPAGEASKQPPLDHIVPPPSPGWAPERSTW